MRFWHRDTAPKEFQGLFTGAYDFIIYAPQGYYYPAEKMAKAFHSYKEINWEDARKDSTFDGVTFFAIKEDDSD